MKTFPHKLRRIKQVDGEDKIEFLGPSLVILTAEEATNLAVAINREATKAKHDFIDNLTPFTTCTVFKYLTRDLSE